MEFPRVVLLCAVAVGFSACGKKTETVGKEVGEAGYSMTPEGWFGAVGDNDVAVMRKMADGGFDTKVLDAEGNGAMHIAAAAGAQDAAELLLNKGFDINAKGAKGRTPLMAAVMADKPPMVQWLLRQGADPKLRDADGFMALMLAVTEGGKGSVEELAPYNREDLDSALLLASLVGQAGVIDTLTNYGASVYARMEDGRTPLMLAAQNGHKEAAALLIDIGASRFATTESGETARSMAVAAGHADLAEMIENGFSGEALVLETDEQVAEAMEGLAEGEPLALNDVGAVPWNDPVPGQGEGQQDGHAVEAGQVGDAGTGNVPGDGAQPEAGDALIGAALGGAARHQPQVGGTVPSAGGRKKPVKNLGGATVSKAVRQEVAEPEAVGGAGETEAASRPKASTNPPVEDLPMVMRHYRQRELPVEVKKVSGGVALLHLPAAPTKEVQVRQGETIPGSDLVVVRVFSRTEQGKLNNGEPMEVGVVEVEDKDSGLKREWMEGRPASGHDPVALVEDAATGQRYLAKPGQRFHSEDGREFMVNDVRPSQLVIEDAESGEVRTLRLRGPRG